MFLRGRVATDDGTPVPHDALVERVCNARVRQQVYATSRGDFSMELGSMADSYLDASGDRFPQYGQSRKVPGTGISRLELTNCELRATVSGFHSSVISLMELTPASSSNMDVGAIVVHRATKIKGMTLSAVPYKAPRDARRAYEKGLEAERNGRLAEARQYFEKAVEIYPKYAHAWFRLGAVLQNLAQKESARTAYTHATTIDSKFLPPYLSLASMAFEAKDWTQVLNLTNQVLDHDPLNTPTSPVTSWISIRWISPKLISITRPQITSSTRSKRLKRAGSRRNAWTCARVFRNCISYWPKYLLEKTTMPMQSQRQEFTWS